MKNERDFVRVGFVKNFFLSFFFLLLSIILFGGVSVKAQTGTYEEYNVDINVNQDSTMDVTESIVTRWTGEFHYITRDLTLTNRVNLQECQSDSTLQCGGFSFVKFLGVFDENNVQVPQDQVSIGTTSGTDADYMNIKWTFSSSGRDFNNEQFKYSLKYKIFGGLGYFDDYDLFYWNMLPSNRPSEIVSSKMNIFFPSKIQFDQTNLKVLSSSYGSLLRHNTVFNDDKNLITITASNIPISNDFTVLYKFDKEIVQKYATLNIISNIDPIDVKVNEIEITGVSKTLSGLVPGENNLVFSASGYESQEMDINLLAGEIKDVNITLKKSLITSIIEVILICGTCFTLLTIPLGLLLISMKWKKKGIDKGTKRTIIPEYSPPDNMPSYLVGSLKDEKADLVDITSSIIDLAYRRYINIREYTTGKILGFGGSKEYELSKIKGADGLTEAETELFLGLFESGDIVKLSDLKYKFYNKISVIIYVRNYIFPFKRNKIKKKRSRRPS
jgi:hypothetical protein